MVKGMWKWNPQHSRSILSLPETRASSPPFLGFYPLLTNSAVSIEANPPQVRSLLPSPPSLCSWVLESVEKFESLPLLHSFCWFCSLQAGPANGVRAVFRLLCGQRVGCFRGSASLLGEGAVRRAFQRRVREKVLPWHSCESCCGCCTQGLFYLSYFYLLVRLYTMSTSVNLIVEKPFGSCLSSNWLLSSW